MNKGLVVWMAFYCLVSTASFAGQITRTGLAEDPSGNNIALLVGAPNGLPGVDKDLDNTKAMVTNSAYQFHATNLFDQQATKLAMQQNLTVLSQSVGAKGTFLFYFSGHGNQGIIAPTNDIMSIGEIRKAIEDGRTALGPLQRLVLIFDSCNAGSLLDPVKRLMAFEPEQESASLADALVKEFSGDSRSRAYWQKLIVFASSRADESSWGGDDGGSFTVAMRKAFDEVITANSTLGDFVSKTQQYTGQQQHPVARFVPADLSQEKMRQ